MKFILARYPTNDGSGIFAAFAGGTELPLGDLTPAILRDWAAAVIAHLFGPELAAEHAGALAASELMAPDLRQPVDWQQEHLFLLQSDVVSFVLGRMTHGPAQAA